MVLQPLMDMTQLQWNMKMQRSSFEIHYDYKSFSDGRFDPMKISIESSFSFSGQLATIRPSRPPIKFGPGVGQHVGSALNNTTTANNYRRF